MLETILQVLIAGLTLGCLLGLMCMGLSMIFGVMRIINFAQGDFLMIGAYTALFATTLIIGRSTFGPVTPFVATIMITPLMLVVGYGIYRVFLADLTERPGMSDDVRHSAQLMITLGLSLILQNGGLMLLGTEPQAVYTRWSSQAWIVELNGGDILWFFNKARTVSALIALAVVTIVLVIMNRTTLGRAVRAAADDPQAARYCGISIRRVYCIVFALGTLVTALAGSMMASFYPFQPFIGGEFVLIMYAGVILGGMGSLGGAFWGGLIMGSLQQLSTLVLPQQLQNATIFVVFLLLLILRPNGIFGRNTERA